MTALLPGAEASLSVRTHPRQLCLVRAMVRSFAELAGFGGRQLDRIALAVDEACANVIRHAHAGRDDGEFEVSCRVEVRRGCPILVVRLTDRGRAADAGLLKPPEQHDPLVPGGLGLRLMHDIMDDVVYRRSPEGVNVLELCLDCPED